MPYIYKYVITSSGQPVYVGITNGDREALVRRIAQHRHDDWADNESYTIYYAYVKSKSDAEVLEGHYIAVYETYNYYNTLKAKWGYCSFAPVIEWTKYEPYTKTENIQKRLNERRAELAEDLRVLRNKIEELDHKCEVLNFKIWQNEKDRQALKRKAVRYWANTFDLKEGNRNMEAIRNGEKEEAFSLYQKSDTLYEFDTLADFWNTVTELGFRQII